MATTYYFVTSLKDEQDTRIATSFKEEYRSRTTIAENYEEWLEKFLADKWFQSSYELKVREATPEEKLADGGLTVVRDAIDAHEDALQKEAETRTAFMEAALKYVAEEVTSVEDLTKLTRTNQRVNVAHVKAAIIREKDKYNFSDDALKAVWTLSTAGPKKTNLKDDDALAAAKEAMYPDEADAEAVRKADEALKAAQQEEQETEAELAPAPAAVVASVA